MRILKSTLAAASTAFLLAACGGGDEGVIVEERDPSPSGLAGALTVSAATADANLNGAYSSNNVALNNVTKVNPIGGEPETCRFRFSGLVQTPGGRLMDGDIRYIPGNPEVRTTFVSINTIEYRLQGSAGAAVDRANDRVVYTNAVLTSTQGSSNTITLNGFVPMLGNRPEGC